MSQQLAEAAARWLDRRPSRRSLLIQLAVVAAAIATHPLRYLLRPGTAYELIVATNPTRDCPPGALCKSDGYAEMCCTINNGVNACPPGTIAGGWWKADGSIYCNGPRYYIDCVGECTLCTRGCGGGFCPDCDLVPPCDCANGDCGNRRVGCRTFRYGQCNIHIGCVGRLSCRVVSCTPAWQMDPSCTTSSATDNRTANHTAPCLTGSVTMVAPGVAIAAVPHDAPGYWLAAADGTVFSFGSAPFQGAAVGQQLNERIVAIAAAGPESYWLCSADGGVFAFGAPYEGSAADLRLRAPIVDMAGTRDGRGYWLAGRDGGVFAFGTAGFFGSMGGTTLNRPIVAMVAAPDGGGYWLVGTDGGVFSFGSAGFFGSTGDRRLNSPIVAAACAPDGEGYWLLAADGGVFCFGSSGFFGSMGDRPLNAPMVAIAATADGAGYWLAARDGGVFTFGDAVFRGSGVQGL